MPAGTWTPERVIAALQDWAREFGEAPKAYEWSVSAARGAGYEKGRVQGWVAEDPRWPSITTVVVHFGSWSAALEAAGLREERLAPWDMDLAERVEVAERLDRAGLLVAEIAGLLAVKPPTVRRYLRASACPDCGSPVVDARSRRCQSCAPRRARQSAWTAEEIVAALRAWAAEHGCPPTSKDWRRASEGHPGRWSVVRHFDSFSAALRAAGFAPRRISWGREEIIAALNAHLREHGVLPTAGEWKERDATGGRPALHNVNRQFGSWGKALEAAGHSVERWDRQTIIEALRTLGGELGRRPMYRDLCPKRPGLPCYDAVRRQFGSLTAAFEAAGYEPAQWSREAIIAALRAWAAEHGRPPATADWKRVDSSGRRPATHHVRREFGTWSAALREAGLV
ncbi:MAG: homing endonuclease associated repeat-containing protein [Nitrososphaerales archaeon]